MEAEDSRGLLGWLEPRRQDMTPWWCSSCSSPARSPSSPSASPCRGKLGLHGGSTAPDPALNIQGAALHLPHEPLHLVLQVLRQVWASPVGGCGQEVQPVDGAELPLQLPTCLEQPGHERGEHHSRRDVGEPLAPCGPPRSCTQDRETWGLPRPV